jgi:hypothetical protein
MAMDDLDETRRFSPPDQTGLVFPLSTNLYPGRALEGVLVHCGRHGCLDGVAAVAVRW